MKSLYVKMSMVVCETAMEVEAQNGLPELEHANPLAVSNDDSRVAAVRLFCCHSRGCKSPGGK